MIDKAATFFFFKSNTGGLKEYLHPRGGSLVNNAKTSVEAKGLKVVCVSCKYLKLSIICMALIHEHVEEKRIVEETTKKRLN